MDRSLRLFCLSDSEGPVPYPWERRYDITDDIVYYKNIVNRAIVFDLRSRVKLGGSLIHFNRRKKAITGALCDVLNQRIPIMILASCCGSQMFFLIPELIQRCPVCFKPVIYISRLG